MRYLSYISIIVIYCLIPSISQGGPILDVNQHSFLKGDEAVFSIGSSGPSPEPVDVYIAFKLPGNDNLYFWPTFSSSPVPCVTAWVPEFVPMTKFFSYVFSGAEPEGEYRLYAAFLKTGRFDADSLVGPIAELSFRMEQSEAAGPVLNVVPANGQRFSTTTPVFSITFVSPIDLESIKWHSKIQVKSLLSGKVATLYSEGGALWVKLFIPEEDMRVIHRISGDEESLISLETGNDGSILKMPVCPVTIEGETFGLHRGGHYSFSIEFLEGARLKDRTSLAGITIGPIEFFID